MGTPKSFERVRLLLALLSKDPNIADEGGALRPIIVERFGEPDYCKKGLSFVWTNYYEAEMGAPLWRSFLSFPVLVDPSLLADIKTWANSLEERFSSDGKRGFNLDPGLVGLGSFVLATTKGRAHRIALQDGIFAELTLWYESGEFRALPWTYADWQSAEYAAVLKELRERLKKARRSSEE